MIAKYNGTCRACGGTIHKGEQITWSRGAGASHVACGSTSNEDDSAGLERGTLASDRRAARNGLSVIRFSSGAVMTQNSRGRCEDAPCCGCCT